ncbi:GM15450 [Drosophila sechellia]|uniref:GM15450 n=1 Tax=Drosophila sechellia TaxID=7238 RepID=B4IBZ0_DROSE|nr:GM15450 [Drosophila sechellia]
MGGGSVVRLPDVVGGRLDWVAVVMALVVRSLCVLRPRSSRCGNDDSAAFANDYDFDYDSGYGSGGDILFFRLEYPGYPEHLVVPGPLEDFNPLATGIDSFA